MNKLSGICLIWLYLFTVSPIYAQTKQHQVTIKDAFISPGFDARPWAYWYWMYSTVTKEGIIADLKGFHDVGIGGVILMDIGGASNGNLRNRSDKWFELVKVALIGAKKWGIRVSVASPGWSSSGGPWITPEMSMKELTWSEVRVSQSNNSEIELPIPAHNLDYYKDIAVVAFPSPQGDDWMLKDMNPKIEDTAGNEISNVSNLLDNDYQTTTRLPGKFDIVFENDTEVGSVLIRALPNNSFSGKILVWNKGDHKFTEIAKINSNRTSPFASQIGTASFKNTRSRRFRIDLGLARTLQEINLSGGYRLVDWVKKSGLGSKYILSSAESLQPFSSHPSKNDIIPLDKIIHLKDVLDRNNKLSWKVPSGNWTILRIGYTTNGIKIYPPPLGGDGLESDKMSKEATIFNYNNSIKPILKKMDPELSKIIASHHIDSYEAGGQNWTKDFAKEFKLKCGYEIATYFPALTGRIVGSESITEKFLWDFRRTIGDLFAENYFAAAAIESHKDGLTFSNEPYGGPFDFLKAGAAADYPMDEFWFPETQPQEKKLVLPGVNTGHTNNKNIIGAESFTSEAPSIRWNEHPYMWKATGDYLFCSGVNRFTFHVSAHQPLVGEHLVPGVGCFGNGIHFDRNNTWWKHGAKEYVEYVTRCQSLLQQGKHLADLLYFHGLDLPSNIKGIDLRLPNGYDFDVCSEDVLLKLQVNNNLLFLPDGKYYKYLQLPQDGVMTTRLLKKVLQLIKAGATVIGTVQNASPSLSEVIDGVEKTRTNMLNQLWGDSPKSQGKRFIGKGRLIWGTDLQTLLTQDKLIPDFDYTTKADLLINYIHRYTKTKEIYFIANGKQKAGWATCRFRVKDMIPEIYKPYTGTVESCKKYKSVGDYIEIPIWFDQSGSVFVVFHKSESKGPFNVSGRPDPQKLATIKFTGPWQVNFPEGWGAPEKIEFPQLVSYTDHQNEGIKYFSGTAEYNTSINVPPNLIGKNKSVSLDLGEVGVIAEVRINGKKLGTYWKPPFKVDATSAIRGGINSIQIFVTNLWPNRLIGDERQFPADKSYDVKAWEYLRNWKPNTKNPLPDPNRFTFTIFRAWSETDTLLPSGLIGPVTLEITEVN